MNTPMAMGFKWYRAYTIISLVLMILQACSCFFSLVGYLFLMQPGLQRLMSIAGISDIGAMTSPVWYVQLVSGLLYMVLFLLSYSMLKGYKKSAITVIYLQNILIPLSYLIVCFFSFRGYMTSVTQIMPNIDQGITLYLQNLGSGIILVLCGFFLIAQTAVLTLNTIYFRKRRWALVN